MSDCRSICKIKHGKVFNTVKWEKTKKITASKILKKLKKKAWKLHIEKMFEGKYEEILWILQVYIQKEKNNNKSQIKAILSNSLYIQYIVLFPRVKILYFD